MRGVRDLVRVRRLREMFAPEWLVQTLRPERAPVPWAPMVRSALGVGVPLAAGLAVAQPVPGLLGAVGGLLVSISDRTAPYPARLRQIVSASVFGGALGLTVGSLIHGRGWLTVAGLVVVAGVSALISVAGAAASMTGLQLLVYTTLGVGPLGAVRPWWLPSVLLLAGAAWGVLLLLPGWALHPRAVEQRLVADVYRALARKLSAIGTAAFLTERRNVTAALNLAYDQLLTERAVTGGRDRPQARLVALLYQAQRLAEASTTLAREGRRPPGTVIAAVGVLAGVIAGGGTPGTVPPLPAGAGTGLVALRDGLVAATGIVTGARPAAGENSFRPGAAGGHRFLLFPGARDPVRGGRLTLVVTLRLMLCVGIASAVSDVLPVPRSYWVVLTVAIVLKPDFGSVFARAVQRGLGTVIGAVGGAVVVIAVPYGGFLLIPVIVFAALIPYGRSRNYGLLAVFLTPLVVLLIDVLTRAGWPLAVARLADTLVGCAIVLLAGYAPWPMAWHADLPARFAGAAGDVARYLRCALEASTGPRERSPLRRHAYRALSDLRTEFQRTMSEPAVVSRRATAWWPAVLALEGVMDSATALAVSADHGGPRPSPAAVDDVAGVLDQVASAVRAGARPPSGGPMPAEEPVRPLAEAVWSARAALTGTGS